MYNTETARDWREMQDDKISERNEFFAREAAHDLRRNPIANLPTRDYGVPALINGEWGVDVNWQDYEQGDLKAGDIVSVRTKSGKFFKVRLKTEAQMGLFLCRKIWGAK